MPVKILTVCLVGISRSVGLTDVLKLHFKPVDVIPVGVAHNANTQETLTMLAEWADHIVIMHQPLVHKFPKGFEDKIKVCDVGPDVYGGSNRAVLIDKVWRWARKHCDELGIEEYFDGDKY